MNNSQHNEPSLGFSLGDVYFVIFRHKWKILLMMLLGVAAATAFYLVRQPPYQSEAKLLVRYISESRGQSPMENNNSQVTPVLDLGRAVLNSEVEILNSFDLAKEVATNIGPDRILAKAGGGNDPIRAAFIVAGGLTVDVGQDTSVIHLTFKNHDPDLVQPVLSEIIKDYLEMHTEVHKSAGISYELLTEETSQLKMLIAQTADELQSAKTNAGIVDIADSQKAYSDEIAHIRAEILQTEADLAEHQAILDRQANKLAVAPTTEVSTSAPPAAISVPPDQLDNYRAICSRLAGLQKKEDDYLSQEGYTEENKLVIEVRSQIAEVTKQKTALESKYSSLAETAAVTPTLAAAPMVDTTETQRGLALPARLKVLEAQLAQVQSDAAKLDLAEIKIADLQRRQDIQEKDYQSFASSLDEARIDEALGPGQVSDIKTIQAPAPPYKDLKKFRKNLVTLLAAGLIGGLGWAFLIEFYLDNTIKRPVDVQSKLKMRFFLAIPDLNQNGHRRLAPKERRLIQYSGPAGEGAESAVGAAGTDNTVNLTTPWVVDPALSSFSDALRDRLVVYFESINLTRTPKLVAVTSTNQGSGVSTIAAGLAASLSETGDGRVLLVDMNLEQGAVQQFVHGKPGCKLDDALEGGSRENALVQENLYVVAENSIIERLPRVLPKRFASLVPKLRASDYDYIIFDMPPVSPTSVTSRLAGFMDKVLLVVESEKTDRGVVQHANALLAQSKASVSVVLNKTKKYIPSRLQKDFNSDV